MERKRQRELVLASIAIAVMALAVWTMRADRQPPAANPPAGVAGAGDPQPEHKDKPSGVNLGELGGERPEPEESVRNPFRFKPRAAPPVPNPSPASSVTTPQPGADPVLTGPAQPPPPPRIALKYIGDMADPQKPGGKIAILSDPRGVYYGREGEVIEGRYRIVKIGVESVDLAYLDGRGRQTIRQTGQ